MSQTYPFLSLRTVLRYEPEMIAQGVSEVARSRRGFLTAYKRAGKPSMLPDYWLTRRNGFIARHLVQYRRNPTIRRRLALIAWAYEPE